MSERETPPFELEPGRVRTAETGHVATPFAAPSMGPLELPVQSVRPLQSGDEATTAAPPARRQARAPRRAFRIFLTTAAVAVVGALVAETVSYVLDAVERWPFFGAALGGLTVVAVGSGVFAAAWEAIALRRQLRGLDEAAELRAEAAELAGRSEHSGRGNMLAARVIKLYEHRPELTDGIAGFRRSVTTTHSDGETLSLLVSRVLHPLDGQAYRIVSRAARDTGLAVAFSPNGLLDVALVLWRTSRMIRDIALVYGFRPGRIGRLSLTRRVLANAAMAGAVEYFGDLLTAHVGAGLAGRISAKAGEGTFTALRTARLGLIAIEVCRPVPFTEEDKPRLAELRRTVLDAFLGRDR